MEKELTLSFYELIKVPYGLHQIKEIVQWMQKPNALFIGPGIGRSLDTREILQNIMPNIVKPCVLDADALYHYAQTPFKLPKDVIFTPHMGEMKNLMHASNSLVLSFKLLKQCQDYALNHQLTLVLKGAPSFIFHPGHLPIVNPTGDPGMATAGSGDVLTGLLASLISQGLSCHDAAVVGVYLHGLAGQIAAKKRKTSIGLMASDLIDHFADAWIAI